LYSRNSSKVLNFLIPRSNGRCALSLPKTPGKSKIRKAFFNYSSSGLKFQRSSLASWKVLYFFIGMLFWKRQYFLVVIIKRLYPFSKGLIFDNFLTRKEEIPRFARNDKIRGILKRQDEKERLANAWHDGLREFFENILAKAWCFIFKV
jgi:hypothetical protein